MSGNEAAQQEQLNRLPWGWYLGLAAVAVATGAVGPVRMAAVPLGLLAVGVLGFLADHSRAQVHESDRARLMSNLVQPVAARFLFLAGVVSALAHMVPGWVTVALIVVVILGAFRQAATITGRVEERYPVGERRKNFHWGLFYFNPDDDEMFINSGGLNIPNFGNRYFWVLLATLVGFIVFITMLARLAG